DLNEVALASLEGDHFAECERLQGSAEPRAQSPRVSGHAAHLAVLAREERYEQIALPQGKRADDHGRRPSEGHGVGGYEVRRNPNSRRARSSFRQLRRTWTVRPR